MFGFLQTFFGGGEHSNEDLHRLVSKLETENETLRNRLQTVSSSLAELDGLYRELHPQTEFYSLQARVRQWAEDRKIIPNSNPTSQLMKTVSELGELADATLKGNDEEQVDGVGDVLVTLILYCELSGFDMTMCLARAYATIKDRKGTLTPEGVFVKEEV